MENCQWNPENQKRCKIFKAFSKNIIEKFLIFKTHEVKQSESDVLNKRNKAPSKIYTSLTGA